MTELEKQVWAAAMAIRRRCKRPSKHADDRLCFCPEEGKGYGVRQVLAQKFINGWVNETWLRSANEKAANDNVSEQELWELLFKIEDAANDAYGMWRETT